MCRQCWVCSLYGMCVMCRQGLCVGRVGCVGRGGRVGRVWCVGRVGREGRVGHVECV